MRPSVHRRISRIGKYYLMLPVKYSSIFFSIFSLLWCVGKMYIKKKESNKYYCYGHITFCIRIIFNG